MSFRQLENSNKFECNMGVRIERQSHEYHIRSVDKQRGAKFLDRLKCDYDFGSV